MPKNLPRSLPPTELHPKSGENRFESLLCVEVTCYLSHSGMQCAVLPCICQKLCLAHACWSTRAGQVGARGPTWDCWWSKAGARNLQELIKTVDIIVAGTNISQSPATGQIFSITISFWGFLRYDNLLVHPFMVKIVHCSPIVLWWFTFWK